MEAYNDPIVCDILEEFFNEIKGASDDQMLPPNGISDNSLDQVFGMTTSNSDMRQESVQMSKVE